MHRAHAGRRAATCRPIVLAILAGLWLVPASFGDPPQPKKKDTNARLKSRNVEITTSVEPSRAKPGETVTFKVTAKLDEGYHIYKEIDKPRAPGAGPVYTTFDFFDPAGLKVDGNWKASKEAIKHKEPVWPDLPFVEYYEDEVSWTIKLKVPEGTEPGKKKLRCQMGFMICDEKSCSPPGQWTAPDAELTVLPAAGDTTKPAEAGPKPAAAAPAPTASADPPKASPLADSKDPRSTGTSATASAPPIPGSPTDSAGSGSTPVPRSEIAQKAQQGLIPFMLASAVGGLFALVMPCVWPMVPITVNFFVKQGHGKAGRVKTTGLAITYCLSIIGVFTTVGVLFSFFFSASAYRIWRTTSGSTCSSPRSSWCSVSACWDYSRSACRASS